MPRRSGVPKRQVLPDSKYNSVLVTKIINQVMLDGKKGTAEEIVYGAIDIATAKLSMEPMDLLEKYHTFSFLSISGLIIGIFSFF